MADKQATYSIRFDSNAKQVGTEGAQGLEELKTAVGRAKDNITTLSATMRNLKGSSDEVKAAREGLKAQLEAEKGAVTAATVALLKQGTSYEHLNTQQKAAAAQKAKLDAAMKTKGADEAREKVTTFSEGLKAVGGPARELSERLETLKTGFTTAGGAVALAATAIGAAIATVVGITSAIAEATRSLVEWIVESANAARSAQLMRQAWTGSATGATHLMHQIDALAQRVPIAKDKLQEMSGELVKSLSGTRVSGQGIVDTFNAVAQASAAMGDTAGAKIKEIIDRSKQFGRVSIGLFELQGTGIKQQDVAAELAKRLKVGIGQAQLALMQGRVKVDDAAAAIRAALEKRFGALNLEKMLDLDVIKQKLRETFAALTRDVNIRPLLEDLAKMAKLFDTSTITGKNLKLIITTIGNALGGGFGGAGDKVRRIFLYGELAALNFLIAVKKIDLQLQSAFGKDYKNQIAEWGLGNAESQMRGFADLVERTGKEVQKTITFLRGMGEMAGQAADFIKKAWTGFEDLGAKVIDGLVSGIRSGFDKIKGAVGDLADKVKETFKGALGIHSPSIIFEGYGKQTAAGYQRGVDRAAPATQQAVDRMAPAAPPATKASPAQQPASKGKPAQRPAPIHVTVQVNVTGGGDVGKQLTSPSFVQSFTRAIEEALVSSGLPMQTEPST